MMFRPLRRKKRAISDEAARELLSACKRGVFAVNGDDGYPYAIPVNYFFDAEYDKIYFHGAKAGHKVDALKRDDKVCFTLLPKKSKKRSPNTSRASSSTRSRLSIFAASRFMKSRPQSRS